MSIDRNELERLLAERPTAQRSAMQAVRDTYDEITLMRERGLSWADISDTLAQLGVTTREGQPVPPVTLRSAYFLVSNEDRDSMPPVVAPPAVTVEPGMEPEPNGEPVAEPEPEPEPVPAVEPESGPEPIPEPEAAAVLVPAPVAEDSPEDSPEESAQALPEAAGEDVAAAIPADIPATPDDREPISTQEALPAAPVTLQPSPLMAPLAAPSPAPAPPVVEAPKTMLADEAPKTMNVMTALTDRDANPNPRDHVMLGTIFVLNDRGGVGKTLLSHHLMATAMLEGLSMRVVEYEVNERLARLFGPEVVEHRRISQDFMNLMGSGDGFYEFWDQIGPELQRGGRLYDFGGNISQWFFNWAEVSGFDYYVNEGERLTFFIPVTVDSASLATGMATLDRIAAIAPKARRVLVENGVSGPFSQLDDSQYGRRKAELVEREGVEVISMPPCTAPAWARLTGHRIDQVAQMTREDLVKLGMTPPVASRSLIVIHEWLRGMRTALAPYVTEAMRPSK